VKFIRETNFKRTPQYNIYFGKKFIKRIEKKDGLKIGGWKNGDVWLERLRASSFTKP
jgi:hypothetical protein